MPDSTRSLPFSSGGPSVPDEPGGAVRLGKYLKRYQSLPPGECTTRRCAGTGKTCVCGGCLPLYGSRSCFRFGAGPCRVLCVVDVTGFVTVLPLTLDLTCFVFLIVLIR